MTIATAKSRPQVQAKMTQTTPSVPSFWNDPTLPWFVDMDGTLIRQDITELALDVALQDVRYWFFGLIGLILYYSGYFQITAYRILERFVPVPSARLTFHQRLLQALQRHGRAGGICILATASHVHAARKVAHYVEQLLSAKSSQTKTALPNFHFDDVIGSHPAAGIWDACGVHKAHLIAARAPKGFVYAGNSKDDLHVWQHSACRAMILVNCPPEVKEKAMRTIHKPYVILD